MKVIQKAKQEHKELMMTLAGGNIGEYERLKGVSISDYLIKLDSHVKSME